MKRTDLYKTLAHRTEQQMRQAGTPDRFAQGGLPARKEQRKLDQANGLVPFAVKLDGALASELRTLAETSQTSLNDLVASLLRKGLVAK